MSAAITLKHIYFTGPSVRPTGLDFKEGLNIIYGASNTGKSFAVSTIDYMLGSSTHLPDIDQRKGYDAIWLGLTLPNKSDITLYRATSGGGFKVYKGLVQSKDQGEFIAVLGQKHDQRNILNISSFLLDHSGLADLYVTKDANGEKDSLKFRYVAPYLITDEENIISKASPILCSHQFTKETQEKNTFKALITGLDDSAVVATISQKSQTAMRDAKLELVDELIAQIDDELIKYPDDFETLNNEVSNLDFSLANLNDNVKKQQELIDAVVQTRRFCKDESERLYANLVELEITIERFARLEEVYKTDISRLEALEEGGGALLSISKRNCPVCGAPSHAQTFSHRESEIEMSRKAAEFESKKIKNELKDLETTVLSLKAEAIGLAANIKGIKIEIEKLDDEISYARTLETSTRSTFNELNSKKTQVDYVLALYDRKDAFLARRDQLDIKIARKPKSEALTVGVDGTTAFAFAKVVQKVLEAWDFPGHQNVQFDSEKQDISIGGKPRSANGKGVRALLHAAFKVAVLIFCRENNLPHPGFLILDTPLLTYREPLVNPKYGDLEEDEIAIKKSTLAENFYAHLASLKEYGQIIILENTDPPDSAIRLANIQIFTGLNNNGRYGFFDPI